MKKNLLTPCKATMTDQKNTLWNNEFIIVSYRDINECLHISAWKSQRQPHGWKLTPAQAAHKSWISESLHYRIQLDILENFIFSAVIVTDIVSGSDEHCESDKFQELLEICEWFTSWMSKIYPLRTLRVLIVYHKDGIFQIGVNC